MWFSKVTSLGAVCNTTTSFEDEPCDHQKEGSCPRVVESDLYVTSGTLGGNGKKHFDGRKKKIPRLFNIITWTDDYGFVKGHTPETPNRPQCDGRARPLCAARLGGGFEGGGGFSDARAFHTARRAEARHPSAVRHPADLVVWCSCPNGTGTSIRIPLAWTALRRARSGV